MRCKRSLSVGSLIQPSIGIALSVDDVRKYSYEMVNRNARQTLVKYVAHGAVVNYHDLAQIGLHLAQIFNVSIISECTMLPIVSADEVLALQLQPIYNRIGVLLHRGGKDYEVIPFADLCLLENIDLA